MKFQTICLAVLLLQKNLIQSSSFCHPLWASVVHEIKKLPLDFILKSSAEYPDCFNAKLQVSGRLSAILYPIY